MTAATKWLLGGSGLVLGVAGLALTFLPAEAATALGIDASATATLVFQILGGLLLGAGLTNWNSRASRFGGIYGRPLALGNFVHFLVVAMALVKHVTTVGSPPAGLLTITAVYTIFAIGFGWVTFRASPTQP